MENFLKPFLNLIYPLKCLLCGNPLHFNNLQHLCSKCWHRMSLNRAPFCITCGKPLEYEGLCNDCRGEEKYHFKRAWAVGLYEGVLKDCIHLIKYSGKLCLIKSLAQLMVDFSNQYLYKGTIDIIVPVPLHRVREKERGFNQAFLLGYFLAKKLGVPISYGRLRRSKPTISQSQLKKEERRVNVRDAFRVYSPFPVLDSRSKNFFSDKRALLVDDVFTTGATVSECARVLKGAGARQVEVLTLARGK